MIFTDENKNYEMLLGAYKKLKSYYHYNKNFLFMKKKIAEFENDEEKMEGSLKLLSKIITNPSVYMYELDEWISKIDFYVVPKSFAEMDNVNGKFVTSAMEINKPVNKVNFFIDMPIELHLLETVWSLLLGKIVFDNKIIDDCCYGNVLDNYVIYNNASDLYESINFQKNKLFKIYFWQYCAWKNNAIDILDNNKNNKSMVMVSLDIKEFYYSVKWKFDLLDNIIKDERIKELESLTNIIERIYCIYTELINQVRLIKQNTREKEYLLPIGMFSSMLLANIYLSSYDKGIIENKDILYYGRYVDDMLLVLDVSQKKFKCDDIYLEDLVIDKNNILENAGESTYCIYKHPELILQKNKLKVIYFEQGRSGSLINQFMKMKKIPSQMNVVPNDDLKMTDFDEAAFIIQNFSTETKIRDLGKFEINKFQLGWHMAELVRNSKYKTNQLSKEDKFKRQIEGAKILSFFRGSNALEYSSNWTNALYFFMLNNITHANGWKKFEANIREAIRKLRMVQPEAIIKGKNNVLKTKMKKQLLEQFNICIASALAINIEFYKKECGEAKSLAYKLRKANLFNQYLVTYPLINYADNLEDCIDLTSITLEQLKRMSFKIRESRKMKLSPRFIYIEELFQFTFLERITQEKTWYIAEEQIHFIIDAFYEMNKIDKNYARPLQIEIKNEKIYNNYYMQNVNIEGTKYNLENIRIAVANTKLDVSDCCLGLNQDEIRRNRGDFVKFLQEAYVDEKSKVDFLLFPEFYLPIQWMADVLAYVRKTGITVITGIQYIKFQNHVHNTIGIFSQVCSGKYKSACLIVREKNDYAPFEKKLLALKKYKCYDKKEPIYTIVNNSGISFGTFLCYEFTDIYARSLYKNKADILFIPENNSDTTYFSNMIETTARDLLAFIVQANTSIYGDSRITGPYSRDQRNIVQIKGGDNDSIIIGTVNLRAVQEKRKYGKADFEKEVNMYFNMDAKERYKKENELLSKQRLKISKLSARTDQGIKKHNEFSDIK